MKRVLIFFAFVAFFAIGTYSQKMSEVFACAPRDVLPLMTRNNRLDCIDFIENGMEARVRDKFDNDVVLKVLTSDYLCLVTSDVSVVEMKMLASMNSEGVRDSSTMLIYVAETSQGPASDTHVCVYDSKWNFVSTVQRPNVEAFIRTDVQISQDLRADIIAEAGILTLIRGELSKENNTLTWTLQTGEFTRDTKQAADKCLQPVVVRL